ncbi:MAG: hypothetical protein H0V01_10250 [Bacteroidetes bacterium]|nr:hypothetical protein [Bacteroidota bacterium]HET6246042.1 hypothetical protein [Bacteroidia bacterium]
MEQKENYLKDISEIRSLMERSSRFISLSGLSGVFAGVFALLGAAFAYYLLGMKYNRHYYDVLSNSEDYSSLIYKIVLIALCVLVASIGAGVFFTTRKAKKQGLKIWDKTARKLLINISIPLIAGGLFCMALLYHGIIGLVAPATLVFYGLALLNGSKYTLDDIRYLGICQIILGLISSFYIGYGLLFWASGFGVLHIVYGTAMYFKYESKQE